MKYKCRGWLTRRLLTCHLTEEEEEDATTDLRNGKKRKRDLEIRGDTPVFEEHDPWRTRNKKLTRNVELTFCYPGNVKEDTKSILQHAQMVRRPQTSTRRTREAEKEGEFDILLCYTM